MILDIIKYGDTVLRQKGERVEEFTPKITQLIDDMLEPMREAHGIGLAGLATALDVYAHVKFFNILRGNEWLAHDEAVRFDGEIIFKRAAVDGDFSVAGVDSHAGGRCFATAGTEEFSSDSVRHLNSKSSVQGFARRVDARCP